MRKLIGILTGSFAVLLVVCIFFIFSGAGNNSSPASGKVYTKSAAADRPLDANQLPTVAEKTTEASSRPVATLENKNDYKPPEGMGNLTSEPGSYGQPLSQKQYFSSELYPYRAMLSEELKDIYDFVYEKSVERSNTFTLVEPTTQTGISDVMTAIYGDHPELFWLETAYSYGYTDKGAVVSLTLKYNATIQDFEQSKEKFEKSANGIIEEAQKLGSDLEKEKYVYDAIMDKCVYDENAELNQSAYSALVNGKSVCAGYARAFQYIMLQLKIPTYFCSGYANEGFHAWNIVRIGDKFYNADISWDDSLDDVTGMDTNVYFNVSDAVMLMDHARRGMSVNLPECK